VKNFNALIFLAIILYSCGKEDTTTNTRDCINVEYNLGFQIQLGEEVCFPDGNTLTFSNIEHQFCPCMVLCDWEGGLFITFSTLLNNNSGEKKFFHSKIENDRSVFENHIIDSFSFTYGTKIEELPACPEDFEPEKITLTISISPI